MLGLTAIKTSKKLTVDKTPTLLPPPKEEETRKPRSVLLEPEFWAELSEDAAFHTDVFRAMDPQNPSVPRQDLIESFLKWAHEVYWEDKGGKPKNAADRAAKVQATAERLKAQQKSATKK
jgi:hypothetical protein